MVFRPPLKLETVASLKYFSVGRFSNSACFLFPSCGTLGVFPLWLALAVVCGSRRRGFDEIVFVLLSRSTASGVYRMKWPQSELICSAAEQLCHISRCSVLMEYFSSAAPSSSFPPSSNKSIPRSLAFHRKDYREMAIKGLASITSPISKPLKDSGSLGLGSRTRCSEPAGTSARAPSPRPGTPRQRLRGRRTGSRAKESSAKLPLKAPGAERSHHGAILLASGLTLDVASCCR